MQPKCTPSPILPESIRWKITDTVFMVIDSDWIEFVSTRPIHLIGNGTTRSPHYVRVRGGTLLHRIIAGTPDGLLTDHINGNTLDNRSSNLRIATPSQNVMNCGKYAPATSRYKGVNWRSDRQLWQARIKVNGKNHFIGHFHDEVDAARAYDEAARLHFGEFARLNFPD